MSHRLFVAVPVASAVAAALDGALEPLRASAPRLRWIPSARWHITLAFIGSTPRREAARIAVDDGVAAAGEVVRQLRLQLDGRLDTFGQRVVWAGLVESEPLRVLAEAVRTSLVAAGFELEERAFRAHLTVARAGRRDRVPDGLVRGWSGPRHSWTVEQVLLLRSESGPDGPYYVTDAAWRI